MDVNVTKQLRVFMAGKMNLRKSALRKLSSVKELAGKGYNNLLLIIKIYF